MSSFTRANGLRNLSKLLREDGRPISSIIITNNDATCINIMCERVGNSCICRVASAFQIHSQQYPNAFTHVTELIMAGMNFNTLPDFSHYFPQLERLDISGNGFTELPLHKFTHLKEINISNTPIKPITDWTTFGSMFPQLEWIVARNVPSGIFATLPTTRRFKIIQ
jgi:hypothetical protein